MHKVRLWRRPVGSHRSLGRRKKVLLMGALLAIGAAGALALLLVGCGGSGSVPPPPPPTPTFQPLTQAEVTQIVTAAAVTAAADAMGIAVVGRQGKVLDGFRTPNAPGVA